MQALATTILANVLEGLTEPLPPDLAGGLMGTLLWQLDSTTAMVAECAAVCLGVVCADSRRDDWCHAATVERLGGRGRLEPLAAGQGSLASAAKEALEVVERALREAAEQEEGGGGAAEKVEKVLAFAQREMLDGESLLESESESEEEDEGGNAVD